jgi:transcription elongation factor Elf1
MPMVLLGWGQDSTKVCDAGIMKCDNCNNYATFEIKELARNASLYFITVAKWDRKYYLVCDTCQYGYELNVETKNKIFQDMKSLPSNAVSAIMWKAMHNLAALEIRKLKDYKGDSYAEQILRNMKSKLLEIDCKEKDINHTLPIYFTYLVEELMFCPYCGKKLPNDVTIESASYCYECGKKLD